MTGLEMSDSGAGPSGTNTNSRSGPTRNGDNMEWKLSAVLVGHSGDVRAVAAGPEGCVLSASRDHTARLWHPQGQRDFTEVMAYRGHANFVSAICFLGPCPAHPSGLVLTASNDTTILAYNLQESQPILSFKGHANTVCCLAASVRPGVLLSASWDSTARVWSVDNPAEPLLKLEGHQAVVWGVIELGDGNIATASADKTVCLWDKDGNIIKTLTGHTDCVRALTVVGPDTFLSCANDASIRMWSNRGDCLNTFFGHSNYIYSVSVNSFFQDQCFVSCGEDSTVRIWTSGNNSGTITVPAQSVWSVCCLPNGDIVSGSSDGIVRVFTKDPMRQADDDLLKSFEEEVQKHILSTTQEIGGIKVTDLPGPESLYKPGKSDGQTKMIRAGEKIKCYSWSAAAQTWNELGEVTGSAKATEGKHMYLGKEYDYVFSVDIEDGKPPLKLPYNIEEEPWVAAQAFIHKNNLPQSYLEQVANFIVTNSNRNNTSATPMDVGFADPFTGGSRYVPGSNSNSNQTAGNNADPFTGSSSYTTSKNNEKETNAKPKISSVYFPQKTYLRFDQANVTAIKDKLNEFNAKLTDISLRVSDDDINAIINFADQKSAYNAHAVEKIKIMLNWPKEMLFPVLDILRLAIRIEKVNCDIFSKNDYGPFLLDNLLNNLSPDSLLANQLLSLRILTNAFIHLEGEMFVLKEHESILSSLLSLQNLNKNMEIAISTLLLNMCVALGQQSNTSFLCQCVIELSMKFDDREASFRGVVALGTLIAEAPVKSSIMGLIALSENFKNTLRSYSTSNEQKLSKCSKEILSLL